MNVLYLSGTGNSYDSSAGALINSAASTTSTLAYSVALVSNPTIAGSGNITLSGVITNTIGGNAITYGGTGILTLGGASTYTGGTTVNAGGTLEITSGGTTTGGAGTGPITLNGNAVLDLFMTNTAINNVFTGTNLINIAMGNGNLWFSNSVQLANFSGTFNVTSTIATGGQLVIGESTDVVSINSSATWQIQSGTVVDFNVGQTDPATVYLYGVPYTGANDGALRLDNSVQSGNVILMGNSQIGNGSSGATGGPSTVSGVISSPSGYGFTKVGTNSLVLSAANTYTGTTIVSAGLLDINASGSVQGNVTVNPGASLEMDNAAAMPSTSTLSVASSATANLTYAGTQNINALFVGGLQQAAGIYGASATNPGGVFTGSAKSAAKMDG